MLVRARGCYIFLLIAFFSSQHLGGSNKNNHMIVVHFEDIQHERFSINVGAAPAGVLAA